MDAKRVTTDVSRASVDLTTFLYVITARVFTMSISGVSAQLIAAYASIAPSLWNETDFFAKLPTSALLRWP